MISTGKKERKGKRREGRRRSPPTLRVKKEREDILSFLDEEGEKTS